MMGKSSIYTRTGDSGYTTLSGGKRIPKTDFRIEAYGTIDELNSFIGLLIVNISDEHDKAFLLQLQQHLFWVGGLLATEKDAHSEQLFDRQLIEKLEYEIDHIDDLLPRLKQFILPGGSYNASLAHVCRTITRRAERSMYHIEEHDRPDINIFHYMNRLSDYFFVLARKMGQKELGKEIFFEKI